MKLTREDVATVVAGLFATAIIAISASNEQHSRAYEQKRSKNADEFSECERFHYSDAVEAILKEFDENFYKRSAIDALAVGRTQDYYKTVIAIVKTKESDFYKYNMICDLNKKLK